MIYILAMFFSGADLKPAFRLSRNRINMLVQMLPQQKSQCMEPLNWGAGHGLLAYLWSLLQINCRHFYHATSHSLQDRPQRWRGNDDHPPQSYSFPQTRGDGGGRGYGAMFALLAMRHSAVLLVPLMGSGFFLLQSHRNNAMWTENIMPQCSCKTSVMPRAPGL